MTPWRRRLRRLRIAVTVGLACLVILAAVLVGVLRLLLPQVGLHKPRLEAWLSEQLQRPVSIDQVEGTWGDSGPLLRIEGVHVAASDTRLPPLVIPEAELVVDLGAWLGDDRRWSEFRLRGLDLTLEHDVHGEWQISGLGSGTGSGGSSAADNPLLQLGALTLQDIRLSVVEASQQITIALRASELRVLNDSGRHRLRALIRRDEPNAANLQLVADYDASTASGRVYLGGKSLDLAALLRDLQWQDQRLATASGRLQLWATLRAGAVDSAHAALDLHDIAIDSGANGREATAARPTTLAQLAGVARWQRSPQGWTLDLADLRAARTAATPAASKLRLNYHTDAGYQLDAEQLDLSSASALAATLPQSAGSWFARAQVSGQLQDMSLRYHASDDFDISGHLQSIGFAPVDKVPGVSLLSGDVLGDAAGVVLELPAQALTLNYPRKFRQPLKFDRLQGRVAAFPLELGWRIETDALDIDGPGYALQLRGGAQIEPDGHRPLLDAYALVMPTDVPAAKQFWPIGDMSERAMSWLDRGLVAGRIVSGRAAIHADLDDWPLQNLAGQFKARAELTDLTVDYSPVWPRAEGITAVADFINNGMHVEVSSGSVLGAKATHAVADIPSFKDAVLAMDVEGQGTGAQLLGVVNASPLGTRYAEELKGITLGGTGALKFRLDMPLAPDKPGSVKGEVQLSDSAIVAKKWNIDFAHANGPVKFNSNGFTVGPLAIEHGGLPAQFALAVGADVRDTANAAEARLEGNLPVALVFAGFDALAPWWPRFPGRSDWTVNLNVPRPGSASPIQLVLRSELRGTAIELPAPLDKPAGDALPVELALQLPVGGSPLTLSLGDVLRLRARLADDNHAFAGALAFGESFADTLPASGLSVSGRASRLDLSGWAGVGLGAGPSLLSSLDLKADRAQVGGRELNELGVVLAHQVDQIGISFSGPQLQGTLQIPTEELLKRGITAQFEHLHWPDAPKTAGAEDTDPLAGVIPSTIPPLHMWIGDFRLGAANFGETRLESMPDGGGMRIEQFDTRSDDMQMHVRGQWNGDGKQQRSDIDMDLTSENLGRMLTALGFAGLFDGGQTLAHVDAYWNGSPATFALARLEGKLKLNVNAGRVLDVEPGMGRLFGLFSVREIPRRLALDFGDFFRSGMSFNAISGEFALADGSATTSNLHIASPAADIRITGRTGLRDKDYDQQMVVTPRVGGTLTVVGALAGGPAGAAAGLAVQTLFNKAINQATTARYHVKGSWDKPEITLISREGGKSRPEPPPQ